MALTRRGLLAGILASGFAPAFVGSSILMPVRKIITPLSDFDLLEQLRFTQEQVARAFSVPPQMIELERAKMAALVLITNELFSESLPTNLIRQPGKITSPTRRYRLG